MSNTIAALASAPGRAGISVIRLSGDRSIPILKDVFTPDSAKNAFIPRYLMLGTLKDGDNLIDECMAVVFKAPHSYTGEDSAELHLHGGPLIVKQTLKLLYKKGAVPAAPGEYTRRAFENGKMDLSQAEAVMQLVNAQGELSQKAALRQLQGGTFSFVKDIQKQLTNMLSAIEAVLDFPEELEDSFSNEEYAIQCENIAKKLKDSSDLRSAKLLNQGLELAIIGTPNSGKSSLFNALLMEDRAIVTDIPGTTRDVLRQPIVMGGITVILNDTAGIRDSEEAVEKLGVDRAKKEMEKADLLLIVLDGAGPLSREAYQLLNENKDRKHVVLQSKYDLNQKPHLEGVEMFSSYTGEGIENIRRSILKNADGIQDSELSLQRHVQLALEASDSLILAAQAFRQNISLDLCAVNVQSALNSLGAITGSHVTEDVIDAIFQNFCVGK
ncbi:MAG: tRNA uridine-5-carboxymethylaminomethyl(34) synthesis GTPase MnmE [Eubacteriales bacterium]|nr:tRNA uridine-5-carboxymethylaminomethyl(34) synthesis GTPase MnmE [Eubacteriales bacterium]